MLLHHPVQWQNEELTLDPYPHPPLLEKEQVIKTVTQQQRHLIPQSLMRVKEYEMKHFNEYLPINYFYFNSHPQSENESTRTVPQRTCQNQKKICSLRFRPLNSDLITMFGIKHFKDRTWFNSIT